LDNFSKKACEKQDLWLELDKLVQNFNIEWKWINGHSGNTSNERAAKVNKENGI